MGRKKKYYVPGMISLIGLPILAFFFSPKTLVKPTVVRIFLPDDRHSDNPGMIRFSTDYFNQSISKRKVIELNLFEDDYSRGIMLSRKFEFILRELDRMSFTGDTSTVLKVNLNDRSTFGNVIWLVNQTMVYKIRQWMLADKSFYFVNGRPPTNKSNTTQMTYQTL